MFRALKRTLQNIRSSFSFFSSQLGKKIRSIFAKKIDDSSFEQLEQLFFEADLGTKLSLDLVEHLRGLHQKDPSITTEKLVQEIKEKILAILVKNRQEPALGSPHVILVVGVNGSGKTTTIAKLAHYYKAQGKKVLLCAADTFRAAAVEQLDYWAKKLGMQIIKSAPKADPSSVVFDALTSALAKEYDIVLIDTAGRLQTKTNLMHELQKMQKTAAKKIPDAPHETLLVVDASSGQNAVDQAEIFCQYTPVSSLVLTKLDGSAKGGVVVALKDQKNLDVRFVGTGESEKQLMDFDPQGFVDALLQE